MEQLTSQAVQVLRTMDKHDNIGTQGVVDLLQKPESEFGAGLDSVRARMIGDFLETKGTNNEETLANMRAWFDRAAALRGAVGVLVSSPLITPRFVSRCEMLCVLDDDVTMDDGQTGLDFLLALPKNEDQTWRDGGRPANIAWALDDILLTATEAGVDEARLPGFAKALLAARETKDIHR